MMYGRGYGYGNMMGGYGWFGALFGFLLFALVMVAIVLLIVWAIRSMGGHGHTALAPPPAGAAGHDEAVAIAKKRLASGEITPEQYQEILRTLG